jgi:hypothetical protein
MPNGLHHGELLTTTEDGVYGRMGCGSGYSLLFKRRTWVIEPSGGPDSSATALPSWSRLLCDVVPVFSGIANRQHSHLDTPDLLTKRNFDSIVPLTECNMERIHRISSRALVLTVDVGTQGLLSPRMRVYDTQSPQICCPAHFSLDSTGLCFAFV